MSGLAIVALPSEYERVYDLSSEKVPHVTLLFLGDNTDPEGKITSWVEHVVETSFRPFMLEISQRGTLGPDEADVVFFENTRDLQQLVEFRSLLLKDRAVADAYSAIPQYPEFTPHLTMGYPTSPAKEDDRNYQLDWISFNRISVWTGEYEGPTFQAPRIDWGDDIAMSGVDEKVKELTLVHYGKKGMKWGVRKERVAAGAKRVSAATARAGVNILDSKWEKHATSPEMLKQVQVQSLGKINENLRELNSSPKYKGKSLNENEALRKSYFQDYTKMVNKTVNEKVQEIVGDNYSGTKEARFVDDADGYRIEIREKAQASHSDADLLNFDLKLFFNSLGQVASASLAQTSMEQADIFVGEVLAHYGKKGMKWGVRKDNSGPAVATSKTAPNGRTRVTTTGGAGKKATTDALKVAKKKQVLKKSGPAALSNKDLKAIAERMNLEQQVRDLEKKRPKTMAEKGQAFVRDAATSALMAKLGVPVAATSAASVMGKNIYKQAEAHRKAKK